MIHVKQHIALGGQERLDGLRRLGRPVVTVKEPNVLFVEQEPVWPNVVVLDDVREPFPEVHEPRLRVDGKLVAWARTGDEGYLLVVDVRSVDRFGQGDNVELPISSFQEPF